MPTESGGRASLASSTTLLPITSKPCVPWLPVCREQIELRFDRPFIFAVVHAPSGLALFTGEVHKPEEWKPGH